MAIACRLCDEPTCMYACPRECISVSETTGIMLVDKDVCNGCGWCVGHCKPNAIKCIHAETGDIVRDGFGTIADWVGD